MILCDPVAVFIMVMVNSLECKKNITLNKWECGIYNTKRECGIYKAK
jgi:hypothetical protein